MIIIKENLSIKPEVYLKNKVKFKKRINFKKKFQRNSSNLTKKTSKITDDHVTTNNDYSITYNEPYSYNNNNLIITCLEKGIKKQDTKPINTEANLKRKESAIMKSKFIMKSKKSILLPKLILIDKNNSLQQKIVSPNSLKNETSFSPIYDNINTISPNYPKKILQIKDRLSNYYRIAKCEILKSEIIGTNLRTIVKETQSKVDSILQEKDSDELVSLRNEQKNESQLGLINTCGNNKNMEYISNNKKNLYQHSDLKTRMNSQSVFKFKNTIYGNHIKYII